MDPKEQIIKEYILRTFQAEPKGIICQLNAESPDWNEVESLLGDILETVRNHVGIYLVKEIRERREQTIIHQTWLMQDGEPKS